jgi:hypothetical protein
MMRTIMSYPWNNPEHAMAREAFKIHLRRKRQIEDYCKPYGIEIREHRETNFEQYLADYSKPSKSSYTDDDDAYKTYWDSVAKDNLR